MRTAQQVLVCLLLAGSAVAFQLASPVVKRSLARRRLQEKVPAMQIGDLKGGKDPERNEILAQLRRTFHDSPDESEALSAAKDAERLGLYLDLALCRWSFNLLPHHRTALNVHQPQYTLMFEGLLAKPRPWLYFHVMLPGGVANLDNPEYALVPDSKAPLTGTLMEIVAVQREADSRLSLIVQGLSRGIVLRPTQTLPFSRGDVQLLPDDEALTVSARRARRFLASTRAGDVAAEREGLDRRLAMAAAQAEEAHWHDYENANLTLSMHQTLSQVNYSIAEACARAEAGAIDDALHAAPMAPAVCYRAAGWEPPKEGEDEDVGDDLYAGCPEVLDALMEAVEEASTAGDLGDPDPIEAELAQAEDAEDEAEASRSLLLLEYQVWIELDNLLRALTKARGPAGTTPVPSQLLGLLPPPPEGGWPKAFAEEGLGNSAAQLRERFDGALAEGEELGLARFYSFIPVDGEHYPARRRAQRLSFAIWSVIGGENVELQPLLDVRTTSDRLRFALLRCRDVMKLLGPPPPGKGLL